MTEAADPAITATFMAIALGLVKLLEVAVTALVKKVMPGKDEVRYVELAPATRDMLAETHHMVGENREDVRDFVPELRNSETRLGTKVDAVLDRMRYAGEKP